MLQPPAIFKCNMSINISIIKGIVYKLYFDYAFLIIHEKFVPCRLYLERMV